MVDIAVPRDIEPEVDELPDVYLYSIDDLSQIIEGNIEQRREAAATAETYVHEGARLFLRESRVQKHRDLLKNFREQAKDIQAQELERARKDLAGGTDPQRVLERLSNSLTNKLIHTPTMAIRDASADGRTDLLDYLATLFAPETKAGDNNPDDGH